MKKLLNKKGFTIVELVIVIAVIAILAAVLIPTFSNVIESANKSADLSEAQNSLKAYSAYTSSKGQSLADGTVFKVKKSNRTYVFYKGSLHEFKEHDIVGGYAVILTIGDTNYASNKMTAHYLDDSGKEIEFEKSTEGYVNFFYSTIKNVTFEDGSLNCEIFPGKVVYTGKRYVEQLTGNNTEYVFSELTLTSKSLVKGLVNVSINGEHVMTVVVDGTSVKTSAGDTAEDAKISKEAGKTYTSDQVDINETDGKLTAKNDYKQGTQIVITSTGE